MPTRWRVAVGTSESSLWIELMANQFVVIETPARFRFLDDNGTAAEFLAADTLAIVRSDVFPDPGPIILTPIRDAKWKQWFRKAVSR